MRFEDSARDENKYPKIVYRLVAESISLSNVPAQLLGKILLNVQGLIYSIANSEADHVGGRRPKKTEELFSLNVSFSEGSVAMAFSPALLAPTLDDTMTQTPTFCRASNLLGLLMHKDVEYNEIKLEIEKQIDDPRSRITSLNCLKQLIPPEGKKAEMRFENINGAHSEIELHDELLKRRVEQLLREEMKNYEMEVFGVVTRIKDDMPSPSFFVKNWSGKLAKVQMPEEKRHLILNYLANMVPIRLTGAGTKKRSLEISDLDEIEPNTKIFIDSIREIKLNSIIEAELSYERHDNESDYWVISNDELGAYGVDSTVDKAEEMFKEDLYCEYLTFKDLSDNDLTGKALVLKGKLIDLFEK
jgi:hypothetical protein